MSIDVPTVLFLCVHNAGRSQMAAGWTIEMGGDAVNVLSAGSEPGDRLNPAAVQAMAEVGIDISSRTPQRWTPEMLQSVDVVVSMGCGDDCPVVPGTRRVEWELDDPAGQPIEMVRGVRDAIRVLVEELLAGLDIRTTPRAS
jgi:arsenate reductase